MNLEYYHKNMDLNVEAFYFYCCAGLGDTLLTLGFKDYLERHLGGQVKFIFKKTHAFIGDMYGEESGIILEGKENIEFLHRSCVKKPIKGKIYAAHPCLHPELKNFFMPIYLQNSTQKFMPWFKEFLGIPLEAEFNAPLLYPEMSPNFKSQLEKIAPLNQIVLISPEATSVSALPKEFWEDLIYELKAEGNIIISNVIKAEQALPGTIFVPMTSLEAIQLGLNCRSVYSIRSGFCDILFSRGKDLHVFYPSHSSYYLYSLNDMFSCCNIDERIIFNM